MLCGVDGVSFAIPVDTAVDVMRQLKEHGRVIRPYVGIKMLQVRALHGMRVAGAAQQLHGPTAQRAAQIGM